MRIGIDLMGGDLPPEKLFEAVRMAAKSFPHSCRFIVYAPLALIEILNAESNIEFKEAEEIIAQDDHPLESLRKKKRSSLVLGINDLKVNDIDAFVSIGNTGALIASAALTLKCFSQISRPALLALLPTQKGSVAVVDIGGNVNCTAQQMKQFAQMGVAYTQACTGITTPTVGLLNIGHESIKGDAHVRLAYTLLDQPTQDYIFVGNLEGTAVFAGAVDVLVTDGFTGNVFLKASEGISSLICRQMRDRGIEDPVIEKCFDYAEHGGALLCGINGIVVKSHNYSNVRALYSSIVAAIKYTEGGVVEKMRLKFK